MIATLAMYPFAELAPHYDALWGRIRLGVPWAPDHLDHALGLREAWTDQQLVVGQTCGVPLVQTLGRSVRVIGAFHPAVPGAQREHYRSVVVATRAGAPADFRGDVAAVNEPDSRSGAVSLFHCIHGTANAPQAVVHTGSHAASLALLQSGGATVASIDAVSFAHLGRLAPDLVEGLHQIGWGPLVPSLPLITSRSTDDRRLAELRRAVADAVGDPTLASDVAALRIRGFSPLDHGDYDAAVRPLLSS